MASQDRRYTAHFLNVEDTNPYIDQSWNLPGPRSVQHQMPSPSSSVRTVMTMPMTRSYSSTDYHSNHRASTGNNIDPIFDELSQYMPQNAGLSHANYSHVDRHLEDQPWSTDNMRTSSATNLRVSSHLKVPSALTSPGSDADSILPPDSGYISHRPRSVASNDAGRIVSRNVASDITLQVQHLNVESIAGDGTPMVRRQSDMISQMSGRSGRSSKSIMCDVCNEVSKCQSDFKKHKLKHDKPHKCDEPGCKRGDRGFTTTNDLDRHKKSVHRIGMEKKSYRCAAPKCQKRDKIWPRLDNFKQHVSRMHKEEDEDELIKRSQVPPPARTSLVFDSVSAMPMDTGFAVAGMDKSFSNTPALEISPVDPLLDHDSSSWEPSDPMTEDSLNSTYKFSSQMSTSFLGSGDHRNSGPQHNAIPRRALESRFQQKATRPSLDLHEAMSTSVHADISHDRPQQRKLSDAPQTKAEQQLASRKSSQSKGSTLISPIESVDFQELFLHALQDVTKSSQQNVIFSKEQALKVSQEMLERVQRMTGSTFTVHQRSRQSNSSSGKICSKCGHRVLRDCDMRKHMKRHDRPYGCTYPKCLKRFGAKSDWKRHENNQHFQLVAFRCRQPSADSGSICGHHSYRPSLFKQHLETAHHMSSPDAIEECEARKIGKNCQGSFWCGFCNDIIQLQTKRNEAWVERFTHIANHFEKRKRSIDDWICVESNKAKKDQLDDDEEETTVDEGGDEQRKSTPPPPTFVPQASSSASMEVGPPPPPPPFHPLSVGSSSNKRPAPDESNSLRRSVRRQKIGIQNRFCCNCNSVSMAMEPGCIACDHQICPSCPTQMNYMYDYDVGM